MANDFVNKETLVEAIVDNLNTQGTKVTKKLVNQVVDSLAFNIEGFLAEGYEVKWTKVAKFSVRPTSARTGRNPQTGELMEISASHRVSISPLGNLKAVAKAV